MNKKKIWVSLVAVLAISGLLAMANNFHWFGLGHQGERPLPDAKEEMRKLFAIYNTPDTTLYIKGSVKLFDNEGEGRVFKEEQPFSFSKKHQQFISQLGPVFTFLSDTLLVQLDTSAKYLVVSKAPVPEETAQTPASALPFEKFMAADAAFKLEATVTEKDGQRILRIKSELTPDIKTAVLYYDPVSYRISKAEIEWWKEALPGTDKESGEKTWLSVMHYTYPAGPGKQAGEEMKKLITVDKDGTVKPVGAYKDYTFRSSF